jgi:hypothetical protein
VNVVESVYSVTDAVYGNGVLMFSGEPIHDILVMIAVLIIFVVIIAVGIERVL